jgi:hypothetical protein
MKLIKVYPRLVVPKNIETCTMPTYTSHTARSPSWTCRHDPAPMLSCIPDGKARLCYSPSLTSALASTPRLFSITSLRTGKHTPPLLSIASLHSGKHASTALHRLPPLRASTPPLPSVISLRSKQVHLPCSPSVASAPAAPRASHRLRSFLAGHRS